MNETTTFPADTAVMDTMLGWAKGRILRGSDPKAGAKAMAELDAVLGGTVSWEGMGWERAFSLFTDVIAPSARPFDHPTSLSFVASAPSPAASAFDAVLGAAGIFAGNWDGGSGAIHAEAQALRWLADLAGWPASAGGTFVSGGTLGNLSALHAARVAYVDRHGRPERFRILASTEAHSSIAACAGVMDAEFVAVPVDACGRMDVGAARNLMARHDGVFVIVANAGATNSGAVDDLGALADLAQEHGIWLHVDGAYGLAALACPEARQAFDGIARADSMIVDPHKWLFAPYDCCALIYRDAGRGAAAHGQRAAYLDALDDSAINPSDLALHLSRRARGLPLWFSLATYGTEAYARAVRRTFEIARQIAEGIEARAGLELILGPQLTVILFRVPGAASADLHSWAELHRRAGTLLCLPTTWEGETVLRLCIVNPATNPDEVLTVLETLT